MRRRECVITLTLQRLAREGATRAALSFTESGACA
jgi:hypothetical protein